MKWARAPNGGVVKYVLQHKIAGAVKWNTLQWDELREDTAVVGDLKPHKRYVFRIQALTLEGFSVFTDESEAFQCSRRF